MNIPNRYGTARFKDLGPATKAGGTGDRKQVLGPGRWALSPLSTLPYVGVDVGGAPGFAGGAAVVSWGDVVEIPDGASGGVTNASAHTGDAVFTAIGTGCGYCGTAPRTITIPARIELWPGEAAPTGFRTVPVDTRRARSCYLQFTDLTFVLPVSSLPYTVYYGAPERGSAWGSLTAKKQFLTYSPTLVGYCRSLPCGIGSGENREAAPGANSLPEARPMALLDQLFVEFLTVNANAVGMTDETRDAYFVLEY